MPGTRLNKMPFSCCQWNATLQSENVLVKALLENALLSHSTTCQKSAMVVGLGLGLS